MSELGLSLSPVSPGHRLNEPQAPRGWEVSKMLLGAHPLVPAPHKFSGLNGTIRPVIGWERVNFTALWALLGQTSILWQTAEMGLCAPRCSPATLCPQGPLCSSGLCFAISCFSQEGQAALDKIVLGAGWWSNVGLWRCGRKYTQNNTEYGRKRWARLIGFFFLEPLSRC